ncbi:YlbF family regulator [Brevibacillus sp. B_LB10_24]|uniref:YlbF family regulator n=1 Tax=Brevibacillus sp. B_LB10_24 TaxID=3380645 RepID=UPI0038BAE32B
MIQTIEPLDMAEMLSQSYALADMINSSCEVSAYLQAKQAMEQDEEAQRLLHLFERKKVQFEEVQRFGKYHPDFHKVSAELRQLKRSLEMLDSVQNFKRAENKLDEMLYSVGRLIADAVSPEIKVPSNNPILEAKASGCGSGGSCGCSTRA